jgi:hypothetical protein
VEAGATAVISRWEPTLVLAASTTAAKPMVAATPQIANCHNARMSNDRSSLSHLDLCACSTITAFPNGESDH